jgi:hypothetical protein
MAVGAFAGHALAPDRIADHYGWMHDRWNQREISVGGLVLMRAGR